MITFGPCVRGQQTCLHRLAAGWINPADLCPACTVRFMTGLEWVAGQPLEWHARYITQSTRVTH
jgi:hypothetical protein